MREPEIVRRRLKEPDPPRKKKKKKPSTNGEDMPVRDAETGRFLPGHPGLPGAGNPYIHRIAALRRVLYEQIDEKAVRKIIRQLIRRALKNDSATGNKAAELILLRALGRINDPETTAIQDDPMNGYDKDERFD